MYESQTNQNNQKHKYEEEIFRFHRQQAPNRVDDHLTQPNKRMRPDETPLYPAIGTGTPTRGPSNIMHSNPLPSLHSAAGTSDLSKKIPTSEIGGAADALSRLSGNFPSISSQRPEAIPITSQSTIPSVSSSSVSSSSTSVPQSSLRNGSISSSLPGIVTNEKGLPHFQDDGQENINMKEIEGLVNSNSVRAKRLDVVESIKQEDVPQTNDDNITEITNKESKRKENLESRTNETNKESTTTEVINSENTNGNTNGNTPTPTPAPTTNGNVNTSNTNGNTSDPAAFGWELVPPGNEIDLVRTHSHSNVVCCVRFSKNGKYLATGSNKVAQIFDVDDGHQVASFNTVLSEKGKDKNSKLENDNNNNNSLDNKTQSSPNDESSNDFYVRSVCFNIDSTMLITGMEDNTIQMWNIRDKQVVKTFAGHDSDIYSLDFSNVAPIFISGGHDKKAKVWNAETGKCVHDLGSTGPAGTQHSDGVTSVCISSDGEHVITGSLDRTVRLWNINTGQLVMQYEGHDEPVYSVSFSSDGKTIASGSLDKTIKLWDIRVQNCRSTLSSHMDYVLSVAFSSIGDWLVSGSKDRTVAFWDPRATGKSRPRVSLYGHKNSVIGVATSPTSRLFVTGSGDCQARIWTYANL